MTLQEKINSDFGLWQLHLGLRHPSNQSQSQAVLAIIHSNDDDKSKTPTDSEKKIIRQLTTEILKAHGTNLCSKAVIKILKEEYNYQGSLSVPTISNLLPHVRNDIKNNISDERIVELYKRYSGDDVATMLNLTSATVRARLRQNGVKLRGRSEAKIIFDRKKKGV